MSQYKLALSEKEALLEKEQELQKSMQQDVSVLLVCWVISFDGMCMCAQLSSKDIRLEQLQKELEVLATAKRQLDDQVNPYKACMLYSGKHWRLVG